MFTLSGCDPLCFGHTQTHTHCDCTHALDALLRMAGRGHGILDKENEREEIQVVLCTFLSVQISLRRMMIYAFHNTVQISTACLSKLFVVINSDYAMQRVLQKVNHVTH